ncbi:protein SLX4IP [Melanotaenia boesemani]|uniref:protein SLX4IP n=1 Tax=Melanotaenia boesemani TaxID=1250792 RepID=UPI001C05C26A|nr:protein SLX4IP [Melanotaenia boesemani]XP_041866578.1 protein SLX4IP [Melanotaenia boesemani]
MAPLKFVIKCGNFAVLVDLHVLPLGDQKDTSWFTTGYIKEVTALVRDAVELRVKQYSELLHTRRQLKPKKELAPASAFLVKGENFNLVANFLKRHSNLRCVVKQDLRLFPERYIVCVSCPEDASAHRRNPSLATTELSQQSRSEYFLSAGETQELLNSPTKTKKSMLQKIAKQAIDQRELCGSTVGKQPIDQRASPKNQRLELKAGESELCPESVPGSALEALLEANHKVPSNIALTESMAQMWSTQKQKQEAESEISNETSKRCKPSDGGEDPQSLQAKRTCLGRSPATMPNFSTLRSLQTSKHDLPPLQPHPPVEAKAESKAFPVSECKKTTVEVELLTPGKLAQWLPLTSNNTAQTNQNRLATSLRGLSVKPASSGTSIGSRSTLEEGGSENLPRTSRLRRLKRS